MKCPVCNAETKSQEPSDFGRRRWIDCMRCGDFTITTPAIERIKSATDSANSRATISYYIRNKSKRESIDIIDSEKVGHILEKTKLPTHSELIKNFILLVGTRAPYPGTFAKIDWIHDIASIGGAEKESIAYCIDELEKKGAIKVRRTLSSAEIAFTEIGWDMFENASSN